ncbi:uncharacterized protein LOC106181535 [Lingula anatina]|uniref:Uncharacterized protein LOC106181535 n=1 Tax=Lingula anatina TaxID=7574 RepID=A0A1S3KGP7_LINAN|nr:uncharacterized protein LOC106181535 [Lingula anatina]|eukprot:XP_013421406.1 uncharacterized protein LOC106181535 [Lingula anatina]
MTILDSVLLSLLATVCILPYVENKAHGTGHNQVLMKMVYELQKDIIQDKQQLAQLNALTKQLKDEGEKLTEENKKLKEKIKEINHLLHGKIDSRPENGTLHRAKRQVSINGPAGGAMYIRWGRTTCPVEAELVYSGIAGGSHYTHTGGGSNILCMPRDPQWGIYTDGFQSSGHFYGVEFRTAANDPFHKTNANSITSLTPQDVVCAACRVPTRSSHIMIPAHMECPNSWSKEYTGYLMSSAYTHKRSEYICVDSAPEVDEKGGDDKQGALLYNVEAACGSLPCPDYISGRELTCVVCTK